MKKEVIFAIFLGFVLGLVITFGIWTANKSLKEAPTTTFTPQPSATPAIIEVSPAPTSQSFSSIISSPEDEALVSENSVTLEGIASPTSLVIITYETGDQIVPTDSSGKYSAKIPLEGGYNYIKATAFDANGIATTQEIVVTYTTQKI